MTEKSPQTPRNPPPPAADTKAAAAKAVVDAKAAPASQAESKAKAAAGTAGKAKPTAPPAPAQKLAPQPSQGDARRAASWPILLLFLLVLVLAGALWFVYQSQQRTAHTLQSLNTALQDSVSQAQQAGAQAGQLKAALDAQTGALAAVTQDVKALRGEYRSLDEAFQLLTDRGSDLVLLNDVDHLVVIAQQQLQLGGNVANAIISLETAQAQLARANRPSLASLQQTINGDLDRLRAARTIDVGLLSSQLDELAALVMQAPLLVPDDANPTGAERVSAAPADPPPTPDTPAAADGAQNWWDTTVSRAGDWTRASLSSLREDFDKLISVRRVDDAAALLISPDQATRFRDNLRLRIMTAQLALMMGQSRVWTSETRSLAEAIGSRYDMQSSLSRQALKIARQLEDTDIELALPDVENSIRALEAVREHQVDAAAAEGQS